MMDEPSHIPWDKIQHLKVQENLVLLSCQKRWPYFIQQLSLLLNAGMVPKALLLEPHTKYVSRRLAVYERILRTRGISRLLYRMKIDLLDNLENLGLLEKAGTDPSMERAGYLPLYTCGTGSSVWRTWTLDHFYPEKLRELGVDIIYCGNNSETLIDYINDHRIEFVLAGAAQVLQRYVFERTQAFYLNMHPGVLPYMRGMHSDKWAIYYGINPGATLHIMDADVDTGPIIATGYVPIGEKDSIASLRVKSHELCLSLLRDYLPRIFSRKMDLSTLPKQDLSVGKSTAGMGPLRFAACSFYLWMMKKRVRRRKAIGYPDPSMFINLSHECTPTPIVETMDNK